MNLNSANQQLMLDQNNPTIKKKLQQH